MILLSIVIPAYNCEKTIERCLKGIINENHSNDTEIIIVNDGSTDGTLSICRQYEAKYSFIKVIDKENCGVSAARNDGIKASNGRYIVFIDSDDYVDSAFTEEILLLIEKSEESFDFIIFNSYSVKNDNRTLNITENIGSLNYEQLFMHILYQQINEPWGKVFNADIIRKNNLLFDSEITLGEDFEFLIRYYSKIKKFSYISKPLYYYVINVGSLSHSNLTEKILSQYEKAYVKEINMLQNNSQYQYVLRSSYINLLFRKVVLDGNISVFRNYMKDNFGLKDLFEYKYSLKFEIKKFMLKTVC